MALTEEEFRARVEAVRAEFRAHTAAAMERSRREHEYRPFKEDELFEVPRECFRSAEPEVVGRSAAMEEDLPAMDVADNAEATEPVEVPNDNTPPMTPTEARSAAQKLLTRLVTTSEAGTSGNARADKRNTGSTATSPVVSATSPVEKTPIDSSGLAGIGRIKKRPRADAGDAPAATSSRHSTPNSSSVQASIDFESGIIPEWYTKAKQPQKPGADDRRTWDKLKDLGKLISAIQEEPPKKRAGNMQKLYEELDTLRFTDVTPWGLKRAKLFEPEHGLPQIYDSRYSKGGVYPYYIVSDAKGLHKRWLAKILDGSNMFRGIKNLVREKDKSHGQGQSIDEEYKIDWHYHGEGHLVNGDWFANQLCAVRDGAHGSPQGGISGMAGKGAASISLSGDMYKETDVRPSAQLGITGYANREATSVTSSNRSGTPAHHRQKPAKKTRQPAHNSSSTARPLNYRSACCAQPICRRATYIVPSAASDMMAYIL